MEAKKIEVVKDWPKPKWVCNIQVFLDFANFYRQFIQGFSRIATPLNLILKRTRSLDKPAFNKNDSRKPDSGRNDNNCEIDGFSGDSMEYVK